MSRFPIFTADNAPEASRPVLDSLQHVFGFVPNIAGAIAGSPTLIKGLISVFQNAHAGSFSEAEIQLLLLTNAVTNGCSWAVAFHTHLALQHGLAVEDVKAIRAGRAPGNAQQAALSTLARQFIERRGHLGEADMQAFLAVGFKPAQLLEVILVSAASTITNYVGNLAQPPLEEAFQPHAWQRGAP